MKFSETVVSTLVENTENARGKVMEYILTEHDYHEKFLGKYALVVALPDLSPFSPDWIQKKFRTLAQPGYFISAATNAGSLNEVQQEIEKYLDRVEAAFVDVQRGVFKVKIRKGKTPASVKAEIECFAGDLVKDPYSQMNDQFLDRRKVLSTFYAPASMVLPCDEEGYGYLPQFFVTQKLEELAKRSYKTNSFKRMPVSPAVCPPGIREEISKIIFEKLPTHEMLDAVG
jgi:hypothetical protein